MLKKMVSILLLACMVMAVVAPAASAVSYPFYDYLINNNGSYELLTPGQYKNCDDPLWEDVAYVTLNRISNGPSADFAVRFANGNRAANGVTLDHAGDKGNPDYLSGFERLKHTFYHLSMGHDHMRPVLVSGQWTP